MDTTDAQPDKDFNADTPLPEVAQVIGLDETEQNLLIDASGQRFTVPVDGELRRLVRRSHATGVPAPQPETDDEDEAGAPAVQLAPREIQARIRAGEDPEDLAELTGTDLDTIRRYEGPIIAERDYVIEQAQTAPISRDSEAPLLGEITVDRLAARGVAAIESEWTAYRISGAPWTVEMQFTAGERERSATWSFEPRSRQISALDDEARWLTETEEPRDEPIPTRLSPVRDLVYDVDSDGGVIGAGEDLPASPLTQDSEPQPDDVFARQQDLLDELSSRRGRRQPILGEDEDDPFELRGEIPAAHPPASRPDLAVDAEVLQLPESNPGDDGGWDGDDAQAAAIADEIADVEAQPASKRAASADSPDEANEPRRADTPKSEAEKPRPTRRSARRASVPSWDEIVFGARTD